MAEFIADNPGDWPVHCHMTHHTMTQMGDKFPNMIGVKPGKLDEKIRSSLLPGYMTMGEAGMGDMGTMGMPVPLSTVALVEDLGMALMAVIMLFVALAPASHSN